MTTLHTTPPHVDPTETIYRAKPLLDTHQLWHSVPTVAHACVLSWDLSYLESSGVCMLKFRYQDFIYN